MKPRVRTGKGPVLLAQPHGGTEIPRKIFARLNAIGREMADTDWHITRLYDGLLDDATVVSTPIHRYVIDANRDPTDRSLYPGQNTTSLCPTTTFDGSAIYLDGREPDAEEITDRRKRYHQPYHDAIRKQLERIKKRHGYAILYDCHSIRSRIPYLFSGQLPDFNIGTDSGASCAPGIETRVEQECAAATGYRHVVNGRFKGGWTTRHYGQPEQGVHAIQMELAQCSYMLEQAPWHYAEDKAESLRVILRRILESLAGVFA